jgi:hypothetical protein
MTRHNRRTPTIAENTLRLVGVAALLYSVPCAIATLIEQATRLLGH